MGSRNTRRSSRGRKQSGGGMSFLLALGVALAGLAIGVRFSHPPASAPAPSGIHRGDVETRRRGDAGTERRGDSEAKGQARRRGDAAGGGAEGHRSPTFGGYPGGPAGRVPSGHGGAGGRRGDAEKADPPRQAASPVPLSEAERRLAAAPPLPDDALASASRPAEPATPNLLEAGPSVPEPVHPPPADPAPSNLQPSNLQASTTPAAPTDELSPRATPKPRPPVAISPAVAALEIARGPSARKRIALTFDAGSSAAPTPAILAALRENGLRCTFFLTGRWTEHNPEIVRRIAEEGHEFGNHTYTHPDLTRLPDAQVLAELERTEEEVRRVTGRSTKPYFRPPFGARDARVLRLAAGKGYRCIYWTTDSWDSVKKGIRPDEIRRRVLDRARAGSIVLMHCGSQATANALPDILRTLKEQGYEVVTVSKLLE